MGSSDVVIHSFEFGYVARADVTLSAALTQDLLRGTSRGAGHWDFQSGCSPSCEQLDTVILDFGHGHTLFLCA